MAKRQGNSSELVLALLEDGGAMSAKEILQQPGARMAATYLDAVLLGLYKAGKVHVAGYEQRGRCVFRRFAAGPGVDAPRPVSAKRKMLAAREARKAARIVEERHGAQAAAAVRRAMDSAQSVRVYVAGRLLYSRETGLVEAAA